jgi:hypothetical protein
MVSLKVSAWFELEVTRGSLFVKLGRFERFYNTQGLPSGS